MSLTTKRALAASLRKLLLEKPLDKITIKDITDDCGLNRQTFYYHFHDIFDLMEWTLSDNTAIILEDSTRSGDWQEAIFNLLAYMLENRSLVLNIFRSISRESISSYLTRALRPIVYDMAVTRSKGMSVSDEDLNFLVDMFSFGLAGLVLEWVAGGMKDKYDNADKLIKLLDGILDDSLRKFSE